MFVPYALMPIAGRKHATQVTSALIRNPTRILLLVGDSMKLVEHEEPECVCMWYVSLSIGVF